MTRPSRPCGLLALGILLGGAIGCRDTPGAEHGLVRDSASIRIVAPSPASPPDRLALTEAPFSAPLPEFGEILDVAPAPDDRVVILDPLGPEVVVLDRTGVELARFGRDGDGPGELRAAGLTGLVVLGDTVAVPDILERRVTLFDLEGRVLDVVPADVGDGLTLDWRRGAGEELILRRVSSPQRLEVLSLSRHAFSSLLDLSSLSLPAPSGPLMPLPVWCRFDDGRLVVGRTDAYALRVSDGDVTTAIVRGGAGGGPLDPSDLAHLGELLEASLSRRLGGAVDPARVRALLERTPLPERVPRIAGLRCVGRTELWVERARPVTEMGVEVLRVGSTAGWGSGAWDVFDLEAGTFHRVVLPAGARLTRVTSDRVVGYTEDAYGRKAPTRWLRR